ncbi:MAG: hemerythrin domain-containing protein [Thalassobaculaceae bacterium]|nr:hemerythrin domain-containing protein [Thalassobaculaceae bacterium]
MATKAMERPGKDDKKADTIVEVIVEEHAKLRSLFDRLEAIVEQDRDGRRSLWAETRKELLAHHEAEEESLFDTLVQTSKDARHESLHAISEHGEHKKLIEQMEDLSPDADDWEEKLAELRHDVFHHLEEEEEDVLPIVAEVLSKDEARTLAAKYREVHS